LKPFQIDCRLSIQIAGAACFLRIPAPADAIRQVHRAREKDSCPIWRLTGGDLKLNNGPALKLRLICFITASCAEQQNVNVSESYFGGVANGY